MNFQKAIIVGASSGIGQALAIQLGKSGADIALVARRTAQLEAVAEQVRAAGGTGHVYPHDATRGEEAAALFQAICRDLGGLDLIIYAAGVMEKPDPAVYDFSADRQTVEVNLIGAMAWLNPAAERFQKLGGGTLVGISSVAGDRGREGFPAYSASKAGLDAYLESLRNRVGTSGVRVVTVKPGPVDTAMTKDLDKKPLLISADDAARQILRAASSGPLVQYVPALWRLLMGVIRQIPSAIFQRMKL